MMEFKCHFPLYVKQQLSICSFHFHMEAVTQFYFILKLKKKNNINQITYLLHNYLLTHTKSTLLDKAYRNI